MSVRRLSRLEFGFWGVTQPILEEGMRRRGNRGGIYSCSVSSLGEHKPSNLENFGHLNTFLQKSCLWCLLIVKF
ncbi:hypothetical protein SLEP1_g10925 [Rubroshorea leprosula]|uniref:Uncharacterized protein n=1 Tax=Rubroshorea leprosula TaxID=152421 RepID=A0AAV5IIY1_9ROSI|nr:hypothetical protein SLEP1_g10925 [Rubroshorea leprosula]